MIIVKFPLSYSGGVVAYPTGIQNYGASIVHGGDVYAEYNGTTPPVGTTAASWPYTGSWKITRLAFRNRFTSAEKAAIKLASLDNPAAPTPTRLAAAGMSSQLDDQRDAEHIDLLRPETRAGVQAMESATLIATGRAAIILDTPPTDIELWRG